MDSVIRFNFMARLLVLGVVACSIPLLFGAASGLMVDVTLSDLTSGADAIVIGTIDTVESHWNADHTNIETSATVTVSEVLKGDVPQGQIILKALGGTVDGIEQWVEDEPIFIPGLTAGMFLRESGSDYTVFGSYKGVYTLQSVAIVQGTGPVGNPAPTADQFAAWVQAKLEGRPVEDGLQQGPLPISGIVQAGSPTINSVVPTQASASTASVITISGSGFGSTKGNVVFFYRAEDPEEDGSFMRYELYNPNDILSWTDSEIKVKVLTGFICTLPWPYYCSASSGYLYVWTSNGQTSPLKPFTVSFGNRGVKWNTPVTLYVNNNYQGINAIPAIQNAVNSWNNAISGSYFKFQYGGTSTSTTYADDGENVLYWASLPKGTIAQSDCWVNAAGTITDCNIRFNTLYSWTTGTGSGTTMNVEAIALHELGHWLSLTDLYGDLPKRFPSQFYGYPTDYSKKMFGKTEPLYNNYNLKNLHISDKQGIQWIYSNPIPTISTISPASTLARSTSFTLMVTGTGFLPGSKVRWNGVDRTTHYVSATTLTADIPATDIATAGTVAVTVFNPAPGGGTSNAVNHAINNPVPAISGIAPVSVTAGGSGFTLTVTGTGFVPGSKVMWNGVARTTSYSSATKLTATILASDIATGSTASVTVFNAAPGGGTSGTATFTVNNPAPVVSSTYPTSAKAGGAAFTLSVYGTGFVSGSKVRWNGADLATTYFSKTKLTASIPASHLATAGTAAVTVFNPTPGGGTSGAVSFPVNNPIPVLSGISPTSAQAGGPAFTLTVTGSGFVPFSKVRWKGVDRTTHYVSATSLTADIPAADIAAAGSATVTVSNPAPGGGSSYTRTFTITQPTNPVPVLSGTSPDSAIAGGPGFSLTLTGTGFIGTSKVRWKGVDRTTHYVSATSLTADIPASDIATAGSATVTVFNPAPGGGTSAGKTFTITSGSNPVPTLSGISPASATAGSPAFTLTVTGTGFIGSSKVRWNGVDRTTHYVSATSLTADIPASDIATVGSATVTVFNPAPGGGASAGKTFAIGQQSGNPVPVLSGISPDSATAGGSAFTLTVTGIGFIGSSKVRWNGLDRTTHYVSATSLTADIPASDIATAGSATVTVFNPTPGGGTSAGKTFTITPASGSLEVITAETATSQAYMGYSGTYLQQAQTIKSAETGIVTVQVGLARKGTPTQNINVHIRETLNGPDVAWAVIGPEHVTSTDYTSPTWVTMTGPAENFLTKGSIYFYVFEAREINLQNYYLVPINGNNPYADGAHYKNTVGTLNSNYDMLMKVTFTSYAGSPVQGSGDIIPIHISGE